MLNEVIFYVLEKTIKQYRQFAQSNIDRAGIDITIDQWLILNVIQESPALAQFELYKNSPAPLSNNSGKPWRQFSKTARRQ